MDKTNKNREQWLKEFKLDLIKEHLEIMQRAIKICIKRLDDLFADKS